MSYLILFVVLGILLNTLTLNVRQRTREFGVLRAIGFGPAHLYAMVLGEAAVLGVAGSVLGLLVSHPLLEGLVGRYLQENPQFSPDPGAAPGDARSGQDPLAQRHVGRDHAFPRPTASFEARGASAKIA